ncbi:MFS transporter [Raineyella fluvialis]|uniref:MFS transporter n=2 Tax=Raineyella fluvialis TaxID=2662261 RepID=A0A5Q2FKX7_9ACTN|nr:MFS transporter [Raineyella fluvialis]
MAVVTFWLFAGTVGTVAPKILENVNTGGHTFISLQQMNLAVSITALFSGMFIVVMGRTADRMGRVRVTLVGLVLGIIGSALVMLASGAAALWLMLVGRAIQGLSAACIMPASMALVKTYWDGKGRQRAVSMWSIGSWGGSGLAAIFGGIVASNIGWQWIFGTSIAVSVVSFFMILGTPESKVEQREKSAFDVLGLVLFLVSVLALMIVLIFGKQLGWVSPMTLGLSAIAIVGLTVFVLWEKRQAAPFVDFALFRNTTFTGATISNFILNATIGLLIVSQQMLQKARTPGAPDYVSAFQAGLLTIGYAVAIIAFIRVGEKLLQRFGPRKPMMWGSIIVALTCVLLIPTWVLLSQYKILAAVAYTLFGLGLAFYATPSTDAALSNLPADQAGAGAGIYKMASSLGGAIGAAVSLAIFTGFLGQGSILGETVHFEGVQGNIDLRQAGMFVMVFNLLLCLGAMLSIALTVPKGGGSRDLNKVAVAPTPAPQLPPDDAKAAILSRLSALSLADLEAVEKAALLNQLGKADPKVLQQLVATMRE